MRKHLLVKHNEYTSIVELVIIQLIKINKKFRENPDNLLMMNAFVGIFIFVVPLIYSCSNISNKIFDFTILIWIHRALLFYLSSILVFLILDMKRSL